MSDATCSTCKWWTRYTNDLRDCAGTCSVPLPPIASGGGGGDSGSYLYRKPSKPDYWCVLHTAKS
jgi:hypothetical protein